MPRTYVKKKVLTYSQDDMAKAIQTVLSGEMSVYAASKQFKIPTTTLFDRMKVKSIESVGRPLAIPFMHEQRLANAITVMEKWGIGLSRSEIIEIVAEYVKLNKLNTPFTDNVPGPDWFINFKNRHGLSIKKPQPIEYARKRMTDPFVMSEYFKLLENTLAELNLFNKPEFVWNLDETSLCLDPSKTKVVGKKNRPCTRTTSGTGRENITVLAAVSANGEKNTPLIIYKGKQMWDQWMAKTDDFDFDISYATSTKGWMETTIFYNYLKNILIPAFGDERPILLIYDGHSTHLGPEVVELAIQNNITILKLPPHTSHILQPLDLAVFKSFKIKWDKKLVEWQRRNISKKMPKNVFAQTFAETWQQTDAEVIKNGFKKAGIYPFNPNIIPEDIYQPEILRRFKKSSTSSQSQLKENTKSLKALCIDIINKNPKYTAHCTAERVKDTNYQTTDVISLSQVSRIESLPFVAYKESELPQCLQKKQEDSLKTPEIKVSFEELLLKKIQQEKQNQPTKRKRIASGAEVITKKILKKNKNGNHNKKPGMKKLKKSQKTTLHNSNLTKFNKNQQERSFSRIFDTEYEEKDKETTMDILDEETGIFRTIIVTRAIIERPDLGKVDSSLKEENTNTENSVKDQKKKVINKSTKRKKWEESSTTTEESIMSIHSDSDIEEIILMTDDEDDKTIARKNNEREAIIFNEISYLDEINGKAEQSQTDIKLKRLKQIFDDENYNNVLEILDTNKIHDKEKTMLIKKTEEASKQNDVNMKENEDTSEILENEVTEVTYEIGDTVLVRYYTKRNWKYYVGVITEINYIQLYKKYEILFYKVVKRKNCLKFVKQKRADKDCLPIDLIVKKIQLKQIRENPEEFVLYDADDGVFFT